MFGDNMESLANPIICCFRCWFWFHNLFGKICWFHLKVKTTTTTATCDIFEHFHLLTRATSYIEKYTISDDKNDSSFDKKF